MKSYNVIDYPYKFIVIDDYCDNYEKFEKNFPCIEKLSSPNNGADSYSAISEETEYNEKLWDSFILKHTSKEYFESVCNLIEDHLIKWRPKLLQKIKTKDYTFGILNTNSDIQYDFLFSIDTDHMRKHGLHVHIDYQTTIFQSMIYFKNLNDDCLEGNIHLTKVKKDGTIFDTVKCKYIANRCVIFPHHPSGWHFVSKRNSSYKRKMITVVYHVRKDLQEITPEFFEQKL